MGGFSVECDCGKWFLNRSSYKDHCRSTGHVYHPKRVGAPEAYVIKLNAWGGTSGQHDYLMSDQSIKTMTTDEAIAWNRRVCGPEEIS